MPEPRISSHPVCLHTRQPPPLQITQETSTSALGSVNGKKLGRKPDLRHRCAEHFPHKLQQGAFQIAHPDAAIDDQPLDLRKHMGMGGVVVIASIHFSRANDFDWQLSPFIASIVRTCTGEVWVRIRMSSVI